MRLGTIPSVCLSACLSVYPVRPSLGSSLWLGPTLPVSTPRAAGTVDLPLFVCLCQSGWQPVDVDDDFSVGCGVLVGSKLARFTFLIKFHLICAFLCLPPVVIVVVVVVVFLINGSFSWGNVSSSLANGNVPALSCPTCPPCLIVVATYNCCSPRKLLLLLLLLFQHLGPDISRDCRALGPFLRHSKNSSLSRSPAR